LKRKRNKRKGKIQKEKSKRIVEGTQVKKIWIQKKKWEQAKEEKKSNKVSLYSAENI
jgi:hypothetical protein